MGTNYPAAFDALTNPTGTDPLTAPDHAGQHANANDAIEAIQVVLGRTGTSFPGSPATGAKFYRTDLDTLCVFDGTRWLSTQLFDLPMVGQLAEHTATASEAGWSPVPQLTGSGIYIVRYKTTHFVSTTNDGSKYWTMKLQSFDGNTATDLVTNSTISLAANVWTPIVTALTTVVASSADWFNVALTKVSTPGGIKFNALITYRMIIT